MREFKDKISKITKQCIKCGLVEGMCICEDSISSSSNVEFWLLSHENELTRTSNTGRLIENTFTTTKVFKWHRKDINEELINLLSFNEYNIYLVMAADRESEKIRLVDYKENDKKTVFLILDGTWKEVRKILRKSEYLDKLPILSLDVDFTSLYNLRRNSDINHICTVEVGIELLKLVGEDYNANILSNYFAKFIEKYNKGRKYQGEKND